MMRTHVRPRSLSQADRQNRAQRRLAEDGHDPLRESNSEIAFQLSGKLQARRGGSLNRKLDALMGLQPAPPIYAPVITPRQAEIMDKLGIAKPQVGIGNQNESTHISERYNRAPAWLRKKQPQPLTAPGPSAAVYSFRHQTVRRAPLLNQPNADSLPLNHEPEPSAQGYGRAPSWLRKPPITAAAPQSLQLDEGIIPGQTQLLGQPLKHACASDMQTNNLLPYEPAYSQTEPISFDRSMPIETELSETFMLPHRIAVPTGVPPWEWYRYVDDAQSSDHVETAEDGYSQEDSRLKAIPRPGRTGSRRNSRSSDHIANPTIAEHRVRFRPSPQEYISPPSHSSISQASDATLYHFNFIPPSNTCSTYSGRLTEPLASHQVRYEGSGSYRDESLLRSHKARETEDLHHIRHQDGRITSSPTQPWRVPQRQCQASAYIIAPTSQHSAEHVCNTDASGSRHPTAPSFEHSGYTADGIPIKLAQVFQEMLGDRERERGRRCSSSQSKQRKLGQDTVKRLEAIVESGGTDDFGLLEPALVAGSDWVTQASRRQADLRFIDIRPGGPGTHNSCENSEVPEVDLSEPEHQSIPQNEPQYLPTPPLILPPEPSPSEYEPSNPSDDSGFDPSSGSNNEGIDENMLPEETYSGASTSPSDREDPAQVPPLIANRPVKPMSAHAAPLLIRPQPQARGMKRRTVDPSKDPSRTKRPKLCVEPRSRIRRSGAAPCTPRQEGRAAHSHPFSSQNTDSGSMEDIDVFSDDEMDYQADEEAREEDQNNDHEPQQGPQRVEDARYQSSSIRKITQVMPNLISIKHNAKTSTMIKSKLSSISYRGGHLSPIREEDECVEIEPEEGKQIKEAKMIAERQRLKDDGLTPRQEPAGTEEVDEEVNGFGEGFFSEDGGELGFTVWRDEY